MATKALTVQVPDWLTAPQMAFLRNSVIAQAKAFVAATYEVVAKEATDTSKAIKTEIDTANSIAAPKGTPVEEEPVK